MKNIPSFRPLGQILLDGEFVSGGQLQQALERQQSDNQALGGVLVEMGTLDQYDLSAVLRLQRVLSSPRDIMQVGGFVRQKLGEILLQTRHISAHQLHRALEEQGRTGERLGDILVRLKMIRRRDLSTALHLQHSSTQAFEKKEAQPGLRLGEMLVHSGLISREDLGKALEQQKQDTDLFLGEILVSTGKVSQRQVDRTLWLQKKLLKAAMIAAMAVGPAFYTAQVKAQDTFATGVSAGSVAVPSAKMTAGVEAGYDWTAMANEEAKWILTTQRSTGALTLTPGGDSINPYFANIAMQKVVKLGSSFYGPAVRYLNWYVSKINHLSDNIGVVGTIYDHRVKNGTELPAFMVDAGLADYDSSDSYAATFLPLVQTYYQSSGDLNWVAANLADLKIIAGAINATLQPNGLTFAKMNYRMQYLQDNVEVWRGYSDFADLLRSLGDPDAEKYRQRAELVQSGIEANLYNRSTKSYRVYAGGPSTNWKVFYPDAVSNLWPIIFNLPEAETRRSTLYQKFISNQSSWVRNKADAFPWVSVAVAASMVGDTKNLKSFLANTYANFFPERNWPWYITESGFYMETMLLQPF